MFAYSPTPDRSGEILAAGQLQAAEASANAMAGIGRDIGGALMSIGGSFGDAIKEAREGESAYTALQSIGKMYPAIGKITGALDQLDPRTRHMAARQVLGNFGALSQFAIAGMNNETRQNAPYVDQLLDNQRDVGAGNQTITPGSSTPPVGAGDPANTVPLPEADTPLPAVRGAPGTVVSVPGGRASWDARNRDRQKRGLQPLPYPPGLE